MPLIRSLASKCYTCVISVILLLGEIIPIYSRCAKKKLVYIIIAAPFSYQLSSCLKCTKLNICLSCNVRLILDTKYL